MAVSRILFLRGFPRIRRSFLSRRSRGESRSRGMRLLPGSCPACARPARRQLPVMSCTTWGFSCPGTCAPGGGLLPRLFTLTPLRLAAKRGGLIFCDTFRRAGLSPDAPAHSTRHVVWRCSDFPLREPEPAQRSSATHPGKCRDGEPLASAQTVSGKFRKSPHRPRSPRPYESYPAAAAHPAPSLGRSSAPAHFPRPTGAPAAHRLRAAKPPSSSAPDARVFPLKGDRCRSRPPSA